MTERPFEAVGLSADADRAYPLLVAVRGVTEEQLARQLLMSISRAHAVCEELAALGLVRLGADRRWYPLPPHAGMLPLLSRAQDRLRVGRELLDRLSLEYHRVHEGHRAEEIVQVVAGTDAIRERIGQIHHQAREEVLVFDAGPSGVEPPGVSTVRRRVVVERARVEEEGWHGPAAGSGVRMVDRLPVRMCVVDRAVAVLPVAADAARADPVASPAVDAVRPDAVDPVPADVRESAPDPVPVPPVATDGRTDLLRPAASDAARADLVPMDAGPDPLPPSAADVSCAGPSLRAVPQAGHAPYPAAPAARPADPVMLVVGRSALLEALVQLFESVWAGGVPLTRAGTGRALQERILAMLVLGTTDVAMARSLGVAVRTVQRRIAAMERAAGVDNRIQLVWHAARHGWLD